MQNETDIRYLRTPIIPTRQTFWGNEGDLDYRALCVFAATGFFLDTDTYYQGQQALKPACEYQFSERGEILQETPYFKWHHSPVERSFDTVVDEFSNLFETIVAEQTEDREIILPLSGGLDSRTQAVALKRLGITTNTFSYAFAGGHDETYYAKQIARACGFPFQSFKVKSGYLWSCIEELAIINRCYSEFTHPRQMAFKDCYNNMGDVFSLGHWGDVLFDDMGVPDNLSLEGQVEVLLNKIIKKGGLFLAESLWLTWGLEGDFKSYLTERIRNLLQDIGITNSANAQIRAFKSLYWAPRWTSVNLSVFESVKPISLPYYDNRLCEFICTIPEHFLARRQIQIAYIKKNMPELAKITWQAQRPFNLNTFSYNKAPFNLPYRIVNKINRELNAFKGNPYIQRNWELQFLGDDNDKLLQQYLFDNPNFRVIIPESLVKTVYNKFKTEDAITYSHPLSQLLTLALFTKTYNIISSIEN